MTTSTLSPLPISPDAASLLSYVPPLVARAVWSETRGAELRRFPATVLFADISGFTSLAEQLAHLGAAGAEALSRILEQCFGRLVEVVTAHDGEVFRFAGDAAIVLWEGESPEVLAMAACCGLALKAALDGLRPSGEVRLRLRTGIASGQLLATRVGGIEGRFEYLVAGAPLPQVARAERVASPGEVVLAPEVVARLGTGVRGTALADGFMCLASVDAPRVPRLPRPRAVGDVSVLRAFVSRTVLTRLEAGHADWLAELRRVSVLFASIEGIDIASPDAPGRLDAAVRAVQSAIYGQGGSVNQVLVDDKGTVIVAAWGLPGRTSENDAERAVRAGLSLRERLSALDIGCSVGITTGRVFCGNRGGATRREYAMIGNTVNLAARLMQHAAGGLLTDATTARMAGTRVPLVPRSSLQVKGRKEPVEVFVPGVGEVASRRPPAAPVGRERERSQLREWLRALRVEGGCAPLVLEAEAGLGKSMLVDTFIQEARDAGVRVLYGAGDAIARDVPYLAWRGVVESLLELPGGEPEARRTRALQWLGRHPALLPWAPMLDTLVSLEIPESEVTAQMTSQMRGDATRELVMRLLQDATEAGPVLLVIDDAHWIDSLSVSLVLGAHAEVPRLGLLMATRPPEAGGSSVLAGLGPPLRLGPLSSEEIRALVMHRLGVRELPSEVSELLRVRAEGHPLFSVELALSLRDAGVLVVDGDVARLAQGAALWQLELPSTVEAAITSRIDHLSPQQQLALKVSSVIGRSFALRPLSSIYPVEAERPELSRQLEHLTLLDVLLPEPYTPELSYAFKHIVIRDVAYGLLPFAQRQRLHRAVAEWYERHAPTGDATLATLLAHHWVRAEEPRHAIVWLDRAGEAALKAFANEEALRLLSEADRLEQAGATPEGATEPVHLRQGRRHRLIAEVSYRLGYFPESLARGRKALALLGHPFPQSKLGIGLRLLGETALQLVHRWNPSGTVHTMGGEAAEAARTLLVMAQSAFNINDLPLFQLANLAMLNLTDRAAPSRELAEASTVMGLTTGILQLHGLAEAYGARALATARALDDLSAITCVQMFNSLYQEGVGRWSEASAACREALVLAERLGERRRWTELSALLALASYHTGELDTATVHWRAVYAEALRTSDLQPRAWSLCGLAECALRRGRADDVAQALEVLAEAERVTAPLGVEDRIRVFGLRAWARFLLGERQGARADAETARGLLASHARPNSFWSYEGYAAHARTWLALWAAAPHERPLREAARGACKSLRGFAQVFPMGRARAAWSEARADALEGRPRAARGFETALAEGRRRQMPYERALAHRALARLGNDVARQLAATREALSAAGVVGEPGPEWME